MKTSPHTTRPPVDWQEVPQRYEVRDWESPVKGHSSVWDLVANSPVCTVEDDQAARVCNTLNTLHRLTLAGADAAINIAKHAQLHADVVIRAKVVARAHRKQLAKGELHMALDELVRACRVAESKE